VLHPDGDKNIFDTTARQPPPPKTGKLLAVWDAAAAVGAASAITTNHDTSDWLMAKTVISLTAS
jgi:hypothetical protein